MPASWLDLNANFLKDAVRGRRLHAFLTDTVDQLVEKAERAGRNVAAVIANPSVPLADVVRQAHDAILIAGAQAFKAKGDKKWNGRWTLSGPPDPPIKADERLRLRGRFRSLAETAAKRARLVPPTATPEQAEQAWLHLLKQRGSPYLDGDYRLNDLFEASADLALELEAEEQSGGKQERDAAIEDCRTRWSTDAGFVVTVDDVCLALPCHRRTFERWRANGAKSSPKKDIEIRRILASPWALVKDRVPRHK